MRSLNGLVGMIVILSTLMIGISSSDLSETNNRVTQLQKDMISIEDRVTALENKHLSYERIKLPVLYASTHIFQMGSGTGSGVIIGRRQIDERTIRHYVLTASHVISNFNAVQISLFDHQGMMKVFPNGQVLIRGKEDQGEPDAAIVYFDHDKNFSAATKAEEFPGVIKEAFSVSSHMGEHPMVVPGMVSLPFMFTHNYDERGFTFVGETMNGCSGGGVWSTETLELIGIILAIPGIEIDSTESGQQLLTYIAVCLKWETIKDWLDARQSSYIYEVQ